MLLSSSHDRASNDIPMDMNRPRPFECLKTEFFEHQIRQVRILGLTQFDQSMLFVSEEEC